MELHENASSLTENELAALASLARLRISADRLPRLRDEVLAALSADRSLEPAVQRARVPGGEPFDASWPETKRRMGT